MKFAIVLVSLFALAVSVPVEDAKNAQILKNENDNIGVDQYNYAYETSNGIAHDASGHLINAGTDNAAIASKGSFHYTGDDGKVYSISYVADENGFQPVGDHLPVAP